MALARTLRHDNLCTSATAQIYHTMVQQKRPVEYTFPPHPPRFHAFLLSVPQDTPLFDSGVHQVKIDVSPQLQGNRLEDGVSSSNLPKVINISFVDSAGHVTALHRYSQQDLFYQDVSILMNDLEYILHVDASIPPAPACDAPTQA